MDISVVVPVYGCPEAIGELHRRLTETLSSLTASFEIILVDDCDKLGSWNEIRKVCAEDKRVKGIHLTRNFGQERAITCGLEASKGDAVVVMDCDLQDRPENIKQLYETMQQGYDVVFAGRLHRKDKESVKFFSKLFYRIFNDMSGDDYDSDVANFSIAKRHVINEFLTMREQSRGYTIFLTWLGYKSTVIEVESDARFEGKSSYTLQKKMKLAVDLITAESSKPLYFAIYFGVFFALLALAAIIYFLINYLVIGNVPAGWTSIVISIWLIGGLLMMFMGVIGVYVGNIFQESKARPLYVVQEVLNGDEND